MTEQLRFVTPELSAALQAEHAHFSSPTRLRTVITEDSRDGVPGDPLAVIDGWLMPAPGQESRIRMGGHLYWHEMTDLVIDYRDDGTIRAIQADVTVRKVRL